MFTYPGHAFALNHLQAVALHGLFQVRKGLEKLNGKTAEYQKWLKDGWTVFAS